MMVEELSKEERQMAMFLHLSMFLGHIVPGAGFIVPIVIWQTKKDEMPSLEEHGRNAVNAMITFAIAAVVFGLLALTIVLIPVALVGIAALAIAGIAMPVIAAIKAENGEIWKYPYCLSIL